LDGLNGQTAPMAGKLNRIILLAALALSLNAVYDYSARPVEAKLLNLGDSVPDFNLSLLGGGQATRQGFLGKPVMFYFYANWCPCSHESVANIRRAAEAGKAAGLAVLFVGIQDSQDNLGKFVRTHDLEFPVATEGGQMFADRVGVGITPTTMFVDSQGAIRSFFVGKVERFEQLDEGLKSVTSPGLAPA